jgi:hypothetical protein
MGDEEEIQTMLKAFTHRYRDAVVINFPVFNDEHGYFMIKKGNEEQEIISDDWDSFKDGWNARAEVDEHTVEGW